MSVYPDTIDVMQLPTIARIPKESFLVKVKGNSLKDAYIFDGDIVIVDPNILPNNGDFTVAILDDSAVVKRFFEKKKLIELHSENPKYEKIVISSNDEKFNIIGVVIGIYRSIRKKVI
ncbi:MAG: S24 family peptidase [Melioribacteraceae bacterium]|nr:S24 family peptidase [Melioribacteraceae bacterium]